jgi:hypothetical protein
MNLQRKQIAPCVALLFILTFGAFATSPAHGQAYLYGRGNFAAGTQGMVVVADFNGDGRPDLAVSDGPNAVVDILLGSSTGGFVKSGTYPAGNYPANLVAADFNGDKKLDLAVVNSSSGTVSILLGNGDGTFQNQVEYPVGYEATGLVAADFNGDGKLDLATLSTGDSAVAILLGDGRGGFEVQALIPVSSYPTELVIGDVNGDGKPDLVTCNYTYTGALVALISKGDGSFTQVQSQAPSYATAISLGDFNRDGKLDVLSIGSNSLYLSLGNGDGSFQNSVQISNAPTDYDNTPLLLVGDFNHDHKLDVALSGVWVMLGNGDGTFQNPILSPADATPMAVTDINGDGQADLIAFTTTFNQGSVAVLLGDGNGSFMDISSVGLAAAQNSLGAGITGDFNDDGKLDLAVLESNYPNPQVSVQLGKGGGKFGKPIVSYLNSDANSNFGLAADFNGDKKEDLIVLDGYNNSGFQVALGQGDGTFGTPIDTPLTSSIYSLAVGDFNKDGKADVVATFGNNSGPYVQIFISNGDGTFTPGAQYIDYPNSYVSVADVNGDGNLDLVLTSTSNFNYNLLVFLGNGDGTFRNPILGPVATYISQAAIGDFNGDGKLDVAAFTSGYQSQGLAFLAGNGDGTFANPVYSDTGWSLSGALVAADFNGDGQLDLAVGTGCCNNGALVIPGNGDGTFVLPSAYDSFGYYGNSVLVVGDFNGDGVADIGLAGATAQNTAVELLYLSTPAPSLFPNSLNFGKVQVGKTSSPKKVSFTNIGNSGMKISSIKVSGDFVEKNDCGKSLAVGKSCTIQVSFKPTQKGTHKGTVSISDNAPGSPHYVDLTGIGQ